MLLKLWVHGGQFKMANILGFCSLEIKVTKSEKSSLHIILYAKDIGGIELYI
jgi:hypothetical protein